MAYSRTTWENSPSTNTPLSAANLNNIEQGILNVESANNALAGTVGVAMGTAGTAVNITATQGSVTATQGSVAATQGSVVTLAGTVSTNTSNIATNTSNISSISGSVTTINASLGSVAGTVSTNTTAITNLQGTVTNIVTQPFGTVSANYTIGTADANKLIKTTSATAITITLPPNGSVAFPVGQGIDVVQMAAGSVTFGTAASGTAGTVTILSTPSLILRTQYSGARITKTDTNEWLIIGDMF